MKRLKNIFSVFLRIAISIALLVLLFKFNRIDTRELISDIKSANPVFLLAGLATFIFINLLALFRWIMLLNTAGIKVPLKKIISSYAGGAFFSIFLPSTIGGDLVRAADLAGHTKKTKEVIATIFLDRLSGYIGLVLVVLPAIFLGKHLVLDKVVFSSVFSIIIFLVIILLVLFNNSVYSKISGLLAKNTGKLSQMIKNIHQEIHVFRNHKRLIFLNLGISFLIQFLFPVSVFFIGLALGLSVDFIYFLIFLPIISAVTLLPISIGGLGLREGLFVLYFGKAGVIKQTALAMSLLSFSFVIFYAAIGGLIYVLTVRYRRVQPDKPLSV